MCHHPPGGQLQSNWNPPLAHPADQLVAKLSGFLLSICPGTPATWPMLHVFVTSADSSVSSLAALFAPTAASSHSDGSSLLKRPYLLSKAYRNKPKCSSLLKLPWPSVHGGVIAPAIPMFQTLCYYNLTPAPGLTSMFYTLGPLRTRRVASIVSA